MAQPVRTIISLLVCLALTDPLLGQAIPDTTTTRHALYAELGGFASSASQTPFWFRSRQYGTVPLAGPAGIARIGMVRYLGDYQNPKKVSVKLAAEGVANVGTTSRLILPVAYASLRFGKFEFYGGRRREVFGLVDTLLTSGSYSWSGNALPITKVQLGTQGFASVPFTKGILAVNALFAHGWFNNTDSTQGSFLHQKALFFRLGLAKQRVRLYAGVTHHAQWGGRSTAVGGLAPNGKIPGTLRDYWDIITVSPPPNDTVAYSEFDRVNRAGNHLGSIDAAIEIIGKRSSLFIYYQHPYEDKSGVAFQNVPDGLYGIRWRNTGSNTQQGFRLNQVTAEILSTMNQTGFDIKIGSRLYDGADDYFNNYQYPDGWTHQRRVIGTPFLTRWLDSKPDLHDLKGGFGQIMISNNRVQVLHLGVLGGWSSGTQLRLLLSHSQNFGRPITRDPRAPLTQFSGMAELIIPTRFLGQSTLSLAATVDKGQWLASNTGGRISLRKIITP